ncbi:MAG: DeoR/GlpR transcriptional regulator [Gammaproteobacteria bacterium]|nr:DeoR/GlpR transcriptional regulator [Gammaproteobacteria bacterium]NIR81760.1 DeoR/GlpR transcriptional regulator [Gammaproteobacteria bacterium]NIR88563.1 DeoR/GlpR transcriptional regulator [Gammaproteobacteria bacterium]NIU02867.1 DeoR/GlpR transcriptional regulator [Gammaproteobacteria bacterium]NIV50389.1 DeoR family transcriptional regulator [Gammaproteobacteria bacterium]
MSEQRLPKLERQERILARLHSDVTVRIAWLAEEFGVSTETVRRDLDELYRKGVINRTYGGAARKSLTQEPGIQERGQRNVPERERIAAFAARLIEPGEALMIDCGSTTCHFARELAGRASRLTVVTNCLPVATLLSEASQVRVMLCPGDYSGREAGVYGPETIEFLKRFRVDRAVIGAGGLTCNGPTDADSQGCWVKRTMMAQAEETLLLLDSSKFQVNQFETVCPLEALHGIVSDARPDAALLKCIERASVRLQVAG